VNNLGIVVFSEQAKQFIYALDKAFQEAEKNGPILTEELQRGEKNSHGGRS